MRKITIHALWACADVVEIVRDGLIVLASKIIDDPMPDPRNIVEYDAWYQRRFGVPLERVS